MASVNPRDDDVSNQLNQALTRRKWQTVLTLLNQGKLDNEQRVRALEQTAKFCKENDIIKHVIPYTRDVETELVLTQLVTRRLWIAVGKCLGGVMDQRLKSWTVAEGSKHASDNMFANYILFHCPEHELETVLVQVLERRLWTSVGRVLSRGVSGDLHDLVIERSVAEAPEHRFVRHVWPHVQIRRYDLLLKELAAKGYSKAGKDVCQKFVPDVLCRWTGDRSFPYCSDTEFRNVVSECKNDAFYLFLYEATKLTFWKTLRSMKSYVHWFHDLAALLSASFIHMLGRKDSNAVLGGRHHCTQNQSPEKLEVVNEVQDDVVCFLESLGTDSRGMSVDMALETKLKEWSLKMTQYFETEEPDQQTIFISLQRFLSKYHNSGRNCVTDEKLIVILAVVPLFEDIQNEAIRCALRKVNAGDKFYLDVITHVCMSRVWEQVRREIFRTALGRFPYSAKQFADHTLYDDQRGQALKTAFKLKEWDLFLQLAEHGLMKEEARRVYYRVARYADWKLVRHMFERGADVTEISELVRGTFEDKLFLMTKEPQTKSQSKYEEATSLMQRCDQLAKLERKIHQARMSFKAAVKRSKWSIVLHRVICSRKVNVGMALNAVVQKEQWPVVIQLVKQGTTASQRDLIFPEMAKKQQWGVCRELLERGVSTDLCVKAVSGLMRKNQWTLVARVMEYKVGDDLRRQVIHTAMDRREGGVVWQALRFMEQPLSEEERISIFLQARRHKLWQVAKALSEEKDTTGIAHRDTAMRDALEHGQWDVVDHCELYYADINMKDADGHTALQRAAQKTRFERVNSIVVRGGDQFPLDVNGYSVLHYGCDQKAWNTVKLLVQYHGDINQPSPKGETPLQKLIACSEIDIMECALFWGQDISKGITKDGETVLHAACRRFDSSVLYYFICRGVDPLAVSSKGQTALTQAMFPVPSARMVKECIRLGFSTHQPEITEKKLKVQTLKYEPTYTELRKVIISPLEATVIYNFPLLRVLMYESGACCYKELFRLCTVLELPPGHLRGQDVGVVPWLTGENRRRAELSLEYLRVVATTPRTLMSTCRLTISRCLNVRGKRERDVVMLPLSRSMRSYVMFSDLTDPDYGKDRLLYGGWAPRI